ncbi:response regulator, partial [bacterium AH-315-K03]|nr:response regulator [bacterium AH-315-K03]
ISYHDKNKKELTAALQTLPIHNINWIIITEIKTELINSPIRTLKKTNTVLIAISIAIITLLATLLTRRIADPIHKLSQGFNQASQGIFDITVDIKDSTELGTLAKGYNKMITVLKNDEIENNKREWLNNRMGEINELIRGELKIDTLSQNVLSYLCQHTNAQIGIFHIVEDNIILPRGRFSFYTTKDSIEQHNIGEGLVGQCALENKTLTAHSPQDQPFYIQCGFGKIKLNMIRVTPLSWNNKVVAVLETGSLHETQDLHKHFLEQCSTPIAISVVTALAKERTHLLLKRTQEQSDTLLLQQERLCTANEDLKTKTSQLNRQRSVLENSQKKTEEKAKALSESNKYKSEFLANMSHELRTPLNSLLILARLLAENEQGNLTEDDIESAECILNSGKHLLTLINEIIDLSKIESGKRILHYEKISISEVINTLNNHFLPMSREKSIDFTIHKLKNAPDFFVSDQVKLGQILTNLISNAIKFTSQGQVALSISLENNTELLPHPSVIKFSVKDTGIGIAPDKHSAIFEAFQQADGSTSRTHGGTGLGLAIARGFAQLLEGDIEVQSTPGEGSTFSLLLPENKTHHLLSDTDNSQHNANTQTALGNKIKQMDTINAKYTPPPFIDDRELLDLNKRLLLIIEDDPAFSKIIYKACHTQQCQAIIAPNGETGLTLAKSFPVCGIILDFMLPGLDGTDILIEMKSNPKTEHLPIQVISALEDIGDIRKLGAQGQTTKPISHQALVAIIHSLLPRDNDQPQFLVVENRNLQSCNINQLLKNNNISVNSVNSGHEALEYLRLNSTNPMILNLELSDMSGIELLNTAQADHTINLPDVIVYSERKISTEEHHGLTRFTQKIIIDPTRSQENLLNEVQLFTDRLTNPTEQKELTQTNTRADKSNKLTQRSVLIVDDDMRNTFALAKVLRNAKLQVTLASSGQQCLEILQKNPKIEMVLMDIMMPEMDGYEAIRQIRKQTPLKNLPVIAVTANAMQGDKEKCLNAGADDYVSKPVDIDELLSKINQWL